MGSNPTLSASSPKAVYSLANLFAVKPRSRSHFPIRILDSRLDIAASYSPKCPVSLRTSVLRHSIRFSKCDRLELLKSFPGKRFGQFSRMGDDDYVADVDSHTEKNAPVFCVVYCKFMNAGLELRAS